ncbi:MAG: hypothetical protein ICV72_14670 [Aldersonia sp.]|nr:hypothetical protein [Aldersonia sp.]
MNPWVRLFRLARLQHGVIATWQAVQLGIAASTFLRRVRREQWIERHRGVFVVPGADPGFLSEVSAALLVAGPHALATADTALQLHGVVDSRPPQVTLVIPHEQRAPALRGVRVLRSRTLTDEDATIVQRLRCATPQRGFLDVAPHHDRGRLRVMLIDGRQRQVVSPGDVIARLALLSPRVPGRNRLLWAAHDVDGVGADSVLSDVVHRRLLAAGLTPDRQPVAIDVGGGRHLHPDITFHRSAVCIECDSLAHHRTQRAIDLDHRKDQAYARARWKCLRIGWRRLDHDWDGFARDVRHQLSEWPRVIAALGR